MKVCHIMFNYFPNFPSPYEYARKLVMLGIDVSVVCLNDGTEKDFEIIDGVKIYRIFLYEGRFFSKKHIFPFLRKVKSYLETNEYDLVQIYSFRGCGLLPKIVRLPKAKWLLDVRTGSVNRYRLLALLSDLITRIESISYDQLIALDYHVGKKIFGSTPFDVVPLGADFDCFKPGENRDLKQNLGIKDNAMVIVFSSNMLASRRPDRVLHAFWLVARKKKGLFLIMVGGGSELESLKKIAKERGIEDRVLFTGLVPLEEVPTYLGIADIGLAYVPSTNQFENQPPLKTIECLAAGLPTVATSTAGNKNFIRNGENGILVEDNVEKLSVAICQLVENCSLRDKLAETARSSVEDFDWKNIVKNRLLPVYQKLINGASS